MHQTNHLFEMTDFQQLDLIKKDIGYEIYQVKNIKTGTIYDATIFLNNQLKDPALLSQQLEIAFELNHASLLKYFCYNFKDFSGQPNPTIISENFPIHTLENLIQSKTALEINEVEKLIMIYGIASGLSYLHSKEIIPNNLTSNCILIDSHFHPKIMNYIVPFDNNSSIDNFTPPEIKTNGKYSKSSNVYSFGLILYQILSNQMIENDMKLPNTPFCQHFTQILQKCLFDNPEERISVDDILNYLENVDIFDLDPIQKDLYSNYITMVKSNSSPKLDLPVTQQAANDQLNLKFEKGTIIDSKGNELQTNTPDFEVQTDEKGTVCSVTGANGAINITRGDGNIHFYDQRTGQINRTYNIEDAQCQDYIKVFKPDEDIPDSWFSMKSYPGNCYGPNYIENYRPPLMRTTGLVDQHQKSVMPISKKNIKVMHDKINDQLLDTKLKALSLAHKTCLAFPILHQIAFNLLSGETYLNYAFKCSDKFIIDKLIVSVYVLVNMIDHADEPDFAPKVSAGTIQHVALSLFRRIYYLANVAEIEELRKREKNMNTNPLLDIPDNDEILSVFCEVFLKMYFSKNGLGYIPLFCFAAWCACCNETIVHTKGAYPCFHVSASYGRKPFNYIGFMLQSSLMFDNVTKLFSDNPPGSHPIIHYLGKKEIGTISRNGIQQTVISVSRTRPERPNNQQRKSQQDQNQNRRPQGHFRNQMYNNQRNNRSAQMQNYNQQNNQRFQNRQHEITGQNNEFINAPRNTRNQNGNNNSAHFEHQGNQE